MPWQNSSETQRLVLFSGKVLWQAFWHVLNTVLLYYWPLPNHGHPWRGSQVHVGLCQSAESKHPIHG